jgi:photosystem II stability/assembly factor-like uncharacterized protein
MKRIFLSIIIFISLSIPGNAQWKRIMSMPSIFQNAYYLEVYFLKTNPQYGWACGKNGVVIRTTDGGDTWDGTYIPNAYQLEGIYFANENVGYTSGLISGINAYGGIFKTTDGGKTWFNITPAGIVDMWGNYFWDENNGLVIGGGCDDQQQFYKTTNGGKTWSVFTLNYFGSGLSDLIIDKYSGIGYASGSGAIFKTTDFGRTWDFYSQSGGGDWQEDLMINGNTFLVPFSFGCTGSGGGGGARISTDFGKTWRQTNFGASMFGCFLQSPEKGWVVGWNRGCYYTSNAGKTWENLNCGITAGADLDDIWFANDTLGFVVGLGVYKYIGFDTVKPQLNISSQIPACSGDTVILSVNKSYDIYKWSNGEVTPTIKVTQPGDYWVYVAHNECDSTTTLPVHIEFLPKPKLTLKVIAPLTLCEGDSAIVTAVEDYLSYSWSTGENTKQIVVKKSGKFKLKVTDLNGCSNIDSVNIFFAPNPKAEIKVKGKTNFCVEDSVILSSKYIYPVYKWYKDSDTIPISFDQSINVKETGKYRLFVANESGCIDISEPIDIIVRADTNTFDFSVIQSEPYSLDSTQFPLILCKKVQILNKSWKEQVITNIIVEKNLSFSLPQSQFPITLAPFGSYNLEICYSPNNIGLERDTIILEDLCSPHILPLVANGVPNDYNTNSKCDVSLEFKTIDIISSLKMSFDVPFPNPTTGIVFIPFQIIYQNQKPDNDIYLENAIGNLKIKPIITQTNHNFVNGYNIDSYKAEFDLSHLPSGLYFIVIDGLEHKVFKIIKD